MARTTKEKKIRGAEAAPRPAAASRLAVAIVFLSSFAVYFNSLHNGFVYDDTYQVLKNPWILDMRHISDMFSKSVWSFASPTLTSNYYRPAMHLIYMINYHLFGRAAWGFHLVNVLFHAGSSVLVYLLAARLIRGGATASPVPSRVLPFVAAVLFATHPIHTEAVAWVAALPEVSFAFFCLLSLYLSDKGKTGYFLSVASFFLASLCKETALVLPLLIVAYDYTLGKPGFPFTSYIRKYSGYVLAAGVYFLLRHHALGSFVPHERNTALSGYQYFINVFPLFAQYLEKLVLPINLNAYYVLHPISSIFGAKELVSFVIVLSFAGIAALSFRRNRLVFFSLLLISVPLLPVLYIPVLGGNAFAERYLYLPSFGFVLLIASLPGILKERRPAAAAGFTALCIALVGIYSWGTVQRNTVWKNNYNLYSDMVKKSPDGAVPHQNLGVAFLDRGWTDKAITQFRAALALNPRYADAHNNLGLAYFRKGLMDAAIEEFGAALKANPDQTDAHYNLGLAYFRKGWTDRAIEQYRAALKLNPDYAGAHNDLGVALLRKGLRERAIEQYRTALKLSPDYAEAHNNLGAALYAGGRYDEAIGEYEAALRLKPDYVDAHNNLGAALFVKGKVDEAIEQYRIALKLNPGDADAGRNLESALRRKGLRKRPAPER